MALQVWMEKPFLCPQTKLKLNSEPHGCQACIKQKNLKASPSSDGNTLVRLTYVPYQIPVTFFMHLLLRVSYWQQLQSWLIEWLEQTQFILT